MRPARNIARVLQRLDDPVGFGMTSQIRIAAAVICDADGRMLLVRKRGTNAFMQPGGKIDGDEDAISALSRECKKKWAVAYDLQPRASWANSSLQPPTKSERPSLPIFMRSRSKRGRPSRR